MHESAPISASESVPKSALQKALGSLTPELWPQRAERIWPVLSAVLLVVLLWFYTSLSQRFPFDLAWDMDVTAVHDALLINSGQFPLHLDHPKFVMNLINGWSLRLGRALQLISVVDFSELRQSPSPMLCIAELTLFLRAVQACVIWLSVLLATGLLRLLFPGRSGLHFATLALLSLQIGLLYCCTVMRTEAYSIFLLLGGLYAFCLLLGRSRSDASDALAWLLAGLGFGLAVLTKLQAIMAGPFFLAFCAFAYSQRSLSLKSDTDTAGLQVKSQTGLTRAVWPLVGLSLVLLAALAWQAWRMPSLPGKNPALLPVAAWQAGELSPGAFLGHLKLQFVWLMLLFSLPLSYLVARRKPDYLPALQFYPLFWCGMSLAFVLPVLSFFGHADGWSWGWRFMLQMAQTCFWTDTQASTTAEAGVLLKTLSFALVTDKNYLLLALAVLVIAAYRFWTAPESRRGFGPAGLLFVTGTVVLLFGSRAILRDTIWFEFLGLLSVIILLNQSWTGLQFRSLKTLLVLCLLVPTLNNARGLPAALDQIYLYFAPFMSGEYAPLVNAFYATPDLEYPRIILAAYADGMPATVAPRDVLRQAVEQARFVGPLRQLADLPFLNLKLPVRSMGLAEPGFAVWQRDQVWSRFNWVEPALRGSLLINPLVIKSQPGPMQWLAMNDRADLSERRLQASGGQHLSLLPNTDIQMLFCLSHSDALSLFGEISPAWQPAAKVGSADETYYAFLLSQDNALEILETISGYSEFDRSWLSGLKQPPFFLIHHGNAWGPAYPSWSNMESLLGL